MKRPSRDEQDMVGTHRAIAAVDSGSFDNGQEIALDALAGNVRPMRRRRAANLVQLVNEDDPLILDQGDRLLSDHGTVDQSFRFLFQEDTAGLLDWNLP